MDAFGQRLTPEPLIGEVFLCSPMDNLTFDVGRNDGLICVNLRFADNSQVGVALRPVPAQTLVNLLATEIAKERVSGEVLSPSPLSP